MKNTYPGFLEKIPPGQIISIVIAIALAIPTFMVVRNFVICWSITYLPGVPPASCGLDYRTDGPRITGVQQETPPAVPESPETEVAAPEESLPDWDGGSRVTLLFIGVDERDWEVGAGAPRSDTMMLFTIDPVSKTAGMLSIPRDLWVNIPGLGYSKINTAYAYGEARKLPGGGPGLAMKTVEHVIGVPIQYFAQVDFNAFEEAIDSMGGLFLCPGERITIDPIGPKPPVKIGPECRTYWGYEVLGYARNRKTAGGDIDRAKRQQKVVMALVEQIFSPQNFPAMVSKGRDIYREARSGLRTNLSSYNALRLGVLLSQIPPENIKQGVIDYSMVALDSVIVSNGQKASILKPYPDKIRLLRDEIFSAAGPLSPIASGAPDELMQEDAARVRILNGTNTEGLSEQIGSLLSQQGMQVVESGGSAGRRYDRTVIVVYSPKLYTLRYLVTALGIDSFRQISFGSEIDSAVDIEVRVGADAIDIFNDGSSQ
jgi:polyisoprenyl-teichoic acid--peptidoglycan teichoic acid transferase